MEDKCEHVFVVYSFADAKYICQDCMNSFDNMPDRVSENRVNVYYYYQELMTGKIDVHTSWKESGQTMDSFRQGFLEYIPKTFILTDIHSIGKSPSKMIAGTEPCRKSDPFDIDNVLGTPYAFNLTTEPNRAALQRRFNDISEFTWFSGDLTPSDPKPRLIVEFIDGTKQKVYIRYDS